MYWDVLLLLQNVLKSLHLVTFEKNSKNYSCHRKTSKKSSYLYNCNEMSCYFCCNTFYPRLVFHYLTNFQKNQRLETSSRKHLIGFFKIICNDIIGNSNVFKRLSRFIQITPEHNKIRWLRYILGELICKYTKDSI